MARTKQPASAQKLHHVLAPKLKQSVRSTKALTLPDDFELETSKRCEGRPASAPVRQALTAPQFAHVPSLASGASSSGGLRVCSWCWVRCGFLSRGH